jgi:hypothetical protein
MKKGSGRQPPSASSLNGRCQERDRRGCFFYRKVVHVMARPAGAIHLTKLQRRAPGDATPAPANTIERVRRSDMKWVLNIVAILLILMGGVWFLQGIGVLPGSFMSGQIQWAINGGVAIGIGAALLFFANRARKPSV